MRRKSRKGVAKSPALRVPLAAYFRIFFELGLGGAICGEKAETKGVAKSPALRLPLAASFRIFLELGLCGTMCGEKAERASQNVLFCADPYLLAFASCLSWVWTEPCAAKKQKGCLKVSCSVPTLICELSHLF